VTVLQTDMTQA